MNLDNLNDSELDQDDAGDWNDAVPELEWDEADAQNIAIELIGRRNNDY